MRGSPPTHPHIQMPDTWGRLRETGHLLQGSEEGGKAFWRKRDPEQASKYLKVEEQQGHPQQMEEAKKGRSERAMSLAKQDSV